MPHLAVRGLLLLLPAMAANAADASLLYSTFLGGTAAESAVAVAVDRSGNIYVAGTTHSSDFPVAGSVLPCAAKLGPSDGFVVKLNPSGTSVIYSACLSGSGREAVSALAVDPSGNAYVAGSTNSTDFPVTATAVQPKLAARTDGFVVKLSSTGSIVYSTYIGGNGDDIPIGAAVDSGGQVYLTGLTLSGDLATTKGSVQPVRSDGGDAFVAKLNSTGSAYVYLTFLGGKRIDLGTAIAADKDGNAYVTGFTFSNEFPVTTGAFQTVPAVNTYDGFITKLSADGSRIVYSTYLGGGGNDRLFGIAVDDSGGAYVCGDTTSTDFPVTAAAQKQRNGTYDAIAAKLSPDGAKLVYATYLGGTAGNSASAIAVDSKGRAVLTGDTQSPDFPVTTGALAPSHPGNDRDAFVIRLSGTGAIDYASYLGGTQEEYGMAVAFDSAGNVLIAGQTFSPDFPATSSAVLPFFQGDSKAFLTGLQLP